MVCLHNATVADSALRAAQQARRGGEVASYKLYGNSVDAVIDVKFSTVRFPVVAA